MKYDYTRYNIKKEERLLERCLEMLPALTSWSIILGLLFLTFLKPLAAVIFMIAFLIYWILRLFYINIFLILSFIRLFSEKDINWTARLNEIDNAGGDLNKIKHICKERHFANRISSYIHKRRLIRLARSNVHIPRSTDIFHIVLIPVANELMEVVEPGILSLINGQSPPQRMLTVIALEDRAPEDVKKGVFAINEKHKDNFFDFQIITHPSNIPGEAKAKGANVTHAARQIADYLKIKNIPYENVVISCFDADTVVNPDYFSSLTYYYITTPERTSASFQPVPVFHNNIWRARSFARILGIGTSFFMLIESSNPEKLITASSHSMSFKALVDIGYWPVDLVAEDTAIFWKSFIHFNRNYKVVPMYVTVSMHIPEGKTIRETLLNLYKQRRRWAWGIENFPIVMRAFIKSREIPLLKRIRHGFKLYEGAIAWTTWPFILGIISWLPVMFVQKEFSRMIVYYSYPRIKAAILSLSMIGLLICISISLFLLPKAKTRFGILRKIGHIFEWIMLPVLSIFLSGIPSLDAQTRLLLGRKMEFWVTPKKALD